MFGDTKAIAAISRMAGNSVQAAEFDQKAAARTRILGELTPRNLTD